MGSTELFFFEDVYITERVTRRLLGTAGTEGRPVNLTRFFDLESAPRGPRGKGEGETRDWRVPGRLQVGLAERRRDLLCEAVANTARRSKKTQFTLLYMASLWGVGSSLRGDASWDPQGEVINRHPAVLVALGSFLTNATFRDKLALRHI